jgi:hypothetical protein
VSIVVDAVQGKAYKGKVTEVNPGGNAFSKQFEIKVAVNKDNEGLAEVKSGMYATIVLKEQTKPLITVNENMLVKRGQLVGVFFCKR